MTYGSEEPVHTFVEPVPTVAAIKAVLDAHQQDVWVDPEFPDGIARGDCSSTGEDGYEGHDEPFTQHQAKMVANALEPLPGPDHGITAVALILRGPLILMVHRVDDDCWGPPGGRQDFGEPITYTAVRETHEETGLVVGAGPVVGVTEWVSRERGKHFTMWWIGCRYIDDEKQPEARVMEPGKHKAVRWVHLDMVPTLRLTEASHSFFEQYPNWAERVPQL